MEELEIKETKHIEQFNIITNENDIIISLIKLDREQPIYNVEIKDNKYYLDDVEIVFGVSKLVDGAVENPSNLKEILEQKLEKLTQTQERQAILQWFADNDWKVNKYVLGEWSYSDPRWLEYVEERKAKRARLDELGGTE